MDSLADQLRPEHRLLYEKGEITLHPGQDYPVIRWSEENKQGKRPGSLAKGTGQAVGRALNRDAAVQATFGKNTAAYRDLLPRVIPPTTDPNVRGSAGWILNRLIDAVEGKDIETRVECPHCAYAFQHVVRGRADTNLAFKLFELVAGRAPEHKDINVAVADLTELLNQDFSRTEVFDVTPEEAQRRAAVDFTD